MLFYFFNKFFTAIIIPNIILSSIMKKPIGKSPNGSCTIPFSSRVDPINRYASRQDMPINKGIKIIRYFFIEYVN